MRNWIIKKLDNFGYRLAYYYLRWSCQRNKVRCHILYLWITKWAQENPLSEAEENVVKFHFMSSADKESVEKFYQRILVYAKEHKKWNKQMRNGEDVDEVVD